MRYLSNTSLFVAVATLLLFTGSDGYNRRNRYGSPSSLASGQTYWRSLPVRPPDEYTDQQSPGFGNVDDYGGGQEFASLEDFGDIQQSVNRDPDAEGFGNLVPSRQKQKNPKYTTTPKAVLETTSEQEGTTATVSSSTAAPKSEKYQTGQPEVTTDKGIIRGKIETTPNGKTVYAFYGIPFAKPPVQDLRFKRPVPIDKIESPFDATHKPNACFQASIEIFPGFAGETRWNPNTNISEDCLYINIWVPEGVFQKKDEELVPVLYWLYGGGFFSGSSSLDVYDGGILASQEEVIVISSQYRVGPFGFIYLGTEDAPGNVGLWDQNLAIKWAHENIEEFGGDPNKFTLMGESAGAASVGFHLLSSASQRYFKRGVMMSGLPSQDYSFATPEVLKYRSLKLAKLAGCDHRQAPHEIISCLQNVEPSVLTRLQWRLHKKILEFAFVPTIDGDFLTDHPNNLIINGEAKRAEIIIGTVEDEGSYFLLYQYLKYFHHDQPTSVSRERFLDILKEIYGDRSEIELQAIINHYTNWENPEDGYMNQKKLVDAVGESFFTCPIRELADNWSNRGLKTFYYHLTQRYTVSPWAKWLGTMHGDDIPFFFGEPLIQAKGYSQQEKQLSIYMMRLLANFAKLGIPSEKWERYTSETPVYLELNATQPTDESTPNRFGPKEDSCALWNDFLPQLQRLSAKREQRPKRNRNSNRCMTQSHPSEAEGFDQYLPAPEADGQNPWRNRGIHGGQGFYTNTVDQQYHYHRPCQHVPYCIPSSPVAATPTPQVPIAAPVPKNFGQNKPSFGNPAGTTGSPSCKTCCDVNQNEDTDNVLYPTPTPV